jgi:uncharacterized membrane protein YukC
MKKISFNQGTLTIDQNRIFFELPKSKVFIHSLQELNPLLQNQEGTIPCQISWSDDHHALYFLYQLSPSDLPYGQAVQWGRQIRLTIAAELTRLAYYIETQEMVTTVFHPLNFFVNQAGRVKVMYRGLKGLLPAEGYDGEPVVEQIKRLIAILFSGAKFQEIVVGGQKVAFKKAPVAERAWIRKIFAATDLNQLLNDIRDERQRLVVEEEEVSVPLLKRQTDITSPQLTISTHPATTKDMATKVQSLVRSFLQSRFGFIALLVVLFLVSFFSLIQLRQGTSDEEQAILMQGLRQVAWEQYSSAAEQFAKLDFEQLSKEDQMAVIFTYLRAGKYTKVISLDPKYAEVVVQYLIKKGEYEQLVRINSNAPEVLFEKAAQKKDLDQMQQLKGKVRMDLRRKKLLVDAYLAQMDFEGARQFVEKDGTIELKQYLYEHIPYS